MRKILIFAFLILTGVLAYYAYIEFSPALMGSVPSPDIGTVADSGNGTDPGIETDPGDPGADVQPRITPSHSVAGPSAAYFVSDDDKKLRTEQIALVNTNIDNIEIQAQRMDSNADKISWAGSICSWLILGVTILFENSNTESKDSDSKRKMPPKSGFIGMLAVGAAVCPLTAGEFEKRAAENFKQVDELHDKISVTNAELDSQDPSNWGNTLEKLLKLSQRYIAD